MKIDASPDTRQATVVGTYQSLAGRSPSWYRITDSLKRDYAPGAGRRSTSWIVMDAAGPAAPRPGAR